MILLDVKLVCDGVSDPVKSRLLVQQGRVKLSDALEVVTGLLVLPRLSGPHPRGLDYVRIDTLDSSKIVIVNFSNTIFEIPGVKPTNAHCSVIGGFTYTFTYPMVEPWEKRARRYQDPSCVFMLLCSTVEAFAKSDPDICGQQVRERFQLERI